MSDVEKDGDNQQSKAFKEWYERNKTQISNRRKSRYDTDPEYRAAVIERQRQYRQNHPRKVKQSGGRTKVVSGVEVQVFRIGEAADLVGRDEQTLRGWEDKGVIPKPSVPGVHRNYTKVQVALMKELASIIDKFRYDHAALNEAIVAQSNKIHSQWED